MAFEKLGVGGVLTFDDAQAVRAMTRTQRVFHQLKKSAAGLRIGMTRLGQGLRNLAIAGAGVGIGIGIGVKKAADFEHQMSAVQAITGASGKTMTMLGKKALEMGINTQFSATQSAKAMEHLGRANYDAGQIMKGIGGLVNLAAAEQMNLAQATQIVTDTIGALNLKKSETGEVADVLALASMKAQTSVAQLGEAMSYGAANAKDMGLNLYQTSATMALFAKAGIRGSRAGTAMNAVMRGMLGATRKSKNAMAELGIKMKDFYKDGKLNMAAAIKSIKMSLDKNFKDPLLRNRKVLELFSIRGMTAFNVLAGQGGGALARLSKTLQGASKMTVKGMKAQGAAAIMAARRLDNLKGSMTLLKSSLEAFSIIVSKTFLGSMKKSIQDFTGRLNRLLKVMMALGEDDSLKTQEALAKKFGKTTVQVALGIRDGLKVVSDSINMVKDGIKKLGEMMGKEVGGSTRQIVKVLVAFTGLLAVLAPLMAGLGAAKFMFGALFKVASGSLLMIASLFWPLVLIAGILGLAFLALRKNGESFRETFVRVFKQIYGFGKKLFNEVLLPMGKILVKGIVTAAKAILPVLKAVISFVSEVISDIVKIIKDYTIGLKSMWKAVAKGIASIFVDIVKVIGSLIKAVMSILRPLWKVIVDIVRIIRPTIAIMIKHVMSAAKVVMGLVRKIGKFAVEVGKLIGAIITELRPVVTFLFAVVAKIASVLFPVLAAIFKVAVKIVGVIVRIATVMVKILKPVIVFLLRAFKAVFKAAWGIAKAITKGIIWSIRQLAKALSGLVMMASKVSFLIPGVTKKELYKLSLELAKFGWDIKTPKRMARAEGAQMMTIRQTPDWRIAQKEKSRTEKKKREKKDPCIDLKLNNKLKIDVPVKIGARQVAKATADHQDEIRERAGFSTKPWQKRQVKARAAVLTPFDD